MILYEEYFSPPALGTPERWVNVNGTDGAYKVSSQGRVWSLWKAKRKIDGGLVRPQFKTKGFYANGEPRGYLYVWIGEEGKKKKHVSLARLVLMHHVGSPPSPKHQAAHWDDDPWKNAVSDLRWATPKEQRWDGKFTKLTKNPATAHLIHRATPRDLELARRFSDGPWCRDPECQHPDKDDLSAG